MENIFIEITHFWKHKSNKLNSTEDKHFSRPLYYAKSSAHKQILKQNLVAMTVLFIQESAQFFFEFN